MGSKPSSTPASLSQSSLASNPRPLSHPKSKSNERTTTLPALSRKLSRAKMPSSRPSPQFLLDGHIYKFVLRLGSQSWIFGILDPGQDCHDLRLRKRTLHGNKPGHNWSRRSICP